MPAHVAQAPHVVSLESTLAARSVVERILERHAWAGALVGALVSLIVASVERRHASLGAADRALGGVTAGLVLPLVACLVVGAALGRGRLSEAIEPFSRHGGSPRRASLGILATLAVLLTLAATLIGVLTTLAAGHPGDGLFQDVFAAGWIFGLAGAAYAACFVAASSFGRRGSGRVWFLLLDFVVGSSNGAFSAIFPRSHLRNLVGGSAPFGLQQGVSIWALLALASVAAVFAVWRAGNRRGRY